MDNILFWLSRDSKTLNWIDKNSDDRSFRTIETGN